MSEIISNGSQKEESLLDGISSLNNLSKKDSKDTQNVKMEITITTTIGGNVVPLNLCFSAPITGEKKVNKY
jgi:hypothetical protein